MAKKILLVGSFSSNPNIYMYADSFFTSLQNLGFDVEKFNYRHQFFPQALINKKCINYKLFQKVRLIKPDIIFVIKGELLTAKTLRHIKQTFSCPIINFYPDNPFTLWNGNSNYHVLEALPLYDHFLSWSQALIPPLEMAGSNNVSFFPFGFDKNIFKPTRTVSSVPPIFDACFIGTWEPDREAWMSDLIKQKPNLKLVIWGNKWDKHCANLQVKKRVLGKAIYTHEMMSIFRQSKIVLNLIRQQNSISHNMRSIEIPATGAFQLSHRTPELVNILFKEDESIACFSSLEELCKKIDFYLNNDQARTEIALKSKQHIQQFTLHNQLKKFFKSNNFLPE